MALLVACEPADEGARVLLVRAGDDVVLLPAWSSYERLVTACGGDQPWVAVALDEVAELRAQVGADAVVLDVDLAGAAE